MNAATDVVVDDASACFRSIVVGGTELLCQRDPLADQRVEPELWHGAFWMMPWVGDHDNALPVPVHSPSPSHGVLRHGGWSRRGPRTLGWSADRQNSMWPGTQRVRTTWESVADGLILTLHLVAGTDPLRVNGGWHPWFRRIQGGAIAELQLPEDAMLQADGMWHPAADRSAGRLDNAVRTAGPVVLSWPHATLSVTSSTGNYLIFDAESHGICIEPLLAPLGTQIAVPSDDQLTLRIGLQFSAAIVPSGDPRPGNGSRHG